MQKLTPKTCKMCGIEFKGGSKALFCPSCRVVRRRERDADDRKRKKLGLSRKIGEEYTCEFCGEAYILRSPSQKFCEKCSKNPDRFKDPEREKQKELEKEYNERVLEENRKYESMDEFISRIVEMYKLTGSIKAVSDAEKIWKGTVKKALITAGVYENETSRKVAKMLEEGMSVNQISEALGSTPAVVTQYVPYKRGTYKVPSESYVADRLRIFRGKKKGDL